MLVDYFPLLIFLAAVFVFGVLALFFPAWLAGSRPTSAKDIAYESGIVPRQSARRRFAVSYYLTAMLFIIFDIEIIFLYPWAVTFGLLSVFGFVEMALFIVTVFVAFAYVWRRGGLDWD